ncbi:MAG: GNAT family N-acetyltransferase [Candidatus Nitronauta litoralis]|uniref:GNAT family N-acetyltransferase n=1 Tax=Candidatus Nitronauta litoralis TaxID=2705533 RepID=A0A7T0BY97_9BACT|nr:MAG: GNAT family N-acetyltransferase [Candidatus Nitronauta litoralis]
MTQAHPEIKIRIGCKNDAAVLAEFNQLLAKETEGKELDNSTIMAGVVGGLERPERCQYFVAESRGQVIGQAMITYEWSDWRNGELWWLQSVYVQRDYRRQGVFTGIYRYIESLARKNESVRGLRLYVEEENSPGRKVYSHLGMKHAGYHVYEVEF